MGVRRRAKAEGSVLAPLTALLPPGLRHCRHGSRKLGGFLLAMTMIVSGVTIALVAGGLASLLSGDKLKILLGTSIALSATMLLASLTTGTYWPHRPIRGIGRGLIAITAAAISLLPGTAGAWLILPQLHIIDNTFIKAPVAEPSPILAISIPKHLPVNAVTNVTTSIPAPILVPIATGIRINVLLLGGDAGPGRLGLRTDSINLLSIDAATGDAAIIGIPRNLARAPFPLGRLRDIFPSGFPDLINALYKWGDEHPDEVIAALGETMDTGASAVAASVSELTGQRIDAFILVDMQGFIELVDAAGGVDIYVAKDVVPAAGNVPGGKHAVRDFKQGWHFMDGTDALSFARSRGGDSDYGRMGRQRCVLAALAAQTTPLSLLVAWPNLANVIAERVRTNLTPGMLRTLTSLVGIDPANSRSISLIPPLVHSVNWNLTEIRQLVADTIYPPPTSKTGNTNDVTMPSNTGPANQGVTGVTIGEECLLKP